MTFDKQVNVGRAYAALEVALDAAIGLLQDPDVPKTRYEGTMQYILGARERAKILFANRSLGEEELKKLIEPTWSGHPPSEDVGGGFQNSGVYQTDGLSGFRG